MQDNERLRTARHVNVVVGPVFVNGVFVAQQMARKGARVTAVDTKATAVGFRSRHVAERVLVPPLHRSPGSFASWLLSRGDLYGAIVIPTDDFFLRDIVESYQALAARFKLAVSPPPSTLTALDKELTYEAARDAGLPMPRTRVLDSTEGLSEAAAWVGFPAVLRPAFSIAFSQQFGTKFFHVNDLVSLRESLRKAADAGHKMLLQEVIPGADENVVCCKAYVTDAGEVLAPVAGVKCAIYPPGFGVTQMQEARHVPEVEEGSSKILRHIRLRGSLASVEWKYDPRDRTWKFLEINARSVFAIQIMKLVGADILDMLWRDKLGLPQLPMGPIRYGRRWAYLKSGLLLYRQCPEARRSLTEYLRMYRPPIRFGLLELDDLKPFLYDILPILIRRISKGNIE